MIGAQDAAAERVRRLPPWFLLLFVIILSVHMLAGATTGVTIDLMRSLTPFAREVREFDLRVLAYWRPIAYVLAASVVIGYLWPIVRFFQTPGQPASLTVQRRAISAPFAVAVISFVPWCFGIVFYPLLTLWHFGRWDTALMSQHVLSPLVNGFLAATASYLFLEWLFRSQVVPRVFAAGRIPDDVGGCVTAGVRTRFLLFLGAVAFLPLFTMLGLVRSAAVRLQTTQDPGAVMAVLADTATKSFFLFLLLGVVLTLVLARSLTRPLGEVVAALRRVQRGDLDVRVRVGSSDEVGVLEDGVNAMVAALRDKERIFQTFGRVVEPTVRDYLLSGTASLNGGELRMAAVLFCDLRNFTAMAERLPAAEVVATLNEFFTTMTVWVRECGGFVDKFIGDAMLVVFGLFDDDGRAADPARGAGAAVRCALGMQERLAALNAVRTAAGRETLAMSAAVHAGEVLAGTIGADDRHEFTVIGDTVNVAARLQQACKEQGRSLLVSEAAYAFAREAGLGQELAQREPVALRGRTARIVVYSPV